MAEEQIQEVIAVDGNPPEPVKPRRRLYDRLKEKNKYSKSYEEFEKQFSNQQSMDKLYESLTSQKLYSKSKEDFKNQFFGDIVFADKKSPSVKPIDFSKPIFPTVTAEEAIDRLPNRREEAVANLQKAADENFEDVAKDFILSRMDLLNRSRGNNMGIDNTSVNTYIPPEIQKKEKENLRASINPEDVSVLINDPVANRMLLKNTVSKLKFQGKNEEAQKVAASAYALDATDRESSNPERISKNIEDIKSGQVDYDIETGRLFKPLSFGNSLVQSYKNRTNDYRDAGILMSMSEDDGVKFLDKRLESVDPDTAIDLPRGVGDIIGSEGTATTKSLLAGALVNRFGGTPALANAAAAAASADEIYKRAWINEMSRSYPEFYKKTKSLNPEISDEDAKKIAYRDAYSLATKTASSDLAANAAMTYTGFKLTGAPINFKPQKGIIKAAKEITGATTDFLKKSTPEVLSTGALGAVSQGVKNQIAKTSGLNRQDDEGVLEAAEMGAAMPLVMGAILQAPRVLRQQFVHSFRKTPIEVVAKTATDLVEDGVMTQNQAEQVVSEIQSYKEKDGQIPETVSDDVQRMETHQLMDEFNSNKQKLGKPEEGGLHESTHGPIKERQKEIEWEINLRQQPIETQVKLLKGKQQELEGLIQEHDQAKSEGKSGKLEDRSAIKKQLTDITRRLDESQAKMDDPVYKAKKIIDDKVESGELQGVFAEMAKGNTEEFMKFIAEQAQGELNGVSSRQPTVEAFGEELVSLAENKYPKSEPSRISVIRPEENIQRETITIKPKEDAVSIKSSDEVDVRQQAGDGEGMGQRNPKPEGVAQAESEGQSEKVGTNGNRIVGISHERVNNLAREYGLPEYEGSPERVKEWQEQATGRLRKGDLPNVIEKLRKGQQPDAVETLMMLDYIADLDAKLQSAPTPELLAEMNRAKNLSNIAGRIWGQTGIARQQTRGSGESTFGDYLAQETAAKGTETLSQEEINALKQKYDAGQDAKKGYEEGMANIIEKEAKAAFEKIKSQTPKAPKKTKEQFQKERKAIFTKMREDLLKVAKGGGGLTSSVPGLAQLQAIAPHLTKLIKSYIQEGISAWDDIVSKLHSDLKGVHEGITEEQVKDLVYGYYNTKRKRPPLDPETQKLQDQYIDFLKETSLRRQKAEQQRLSLTERRAQVLDQILGLKRLVETSIDFSIPGRQSVTVSLNPRHLDITQKAFSKMFGSAFSKRKYDRLMFELKESPLYKEMEEAGVAFTEADAVDNINREEDNRTSFLLKIPYLREPFLASNRAASAFQNVARFERYAKLKRIVDKIDGTPEEIAQTRQDAAKWVNNLTGRGNMLKYLESPSGQRWMGRVFYGARLMASRFNLLNPVYYAKMPKAVRVEALKDLGAFAGTMVATGLSMKAAGADISFDPDNPDFLKAKWGDKRYDLSGGLATYLRQYFRIANTIKKRADPEVSDKETAKYAKDVAGGAVKFFRYKLSPNTSYGLDAFMGRTAIGEKFDPYEAIKIYPMYVDDIKDAWKDEGALSLATILVPSVFGVGVQDYEEKKGGSSGSGGASGRIEKREKREKREKQE